MPTGLPLPPDFDRTVLPRTMASILARTRAFLASEAVIGVETAEGLDCDLDNLRLYDVTAVAGLGEGVDLLVAFSFENGLLDVLFEHIAADIVVAESEVAHFRRETAAEVTNIILGLCTADLQNGDEVISLSPPQVIEGERSIRRPRHAVFAAMAIHTSRGCLDVKLIGPRDLFDERLNHRQ